MRTKERALRIAYLSGPVDAVDAHRKWLSHTMPEYFGDSHVTQFFDLCERNRFIGYIITTLPGPRIHYTYENVTIENYSDQRSWRGPLFHLYGYLWLMRRIPELLRFRPDVVLVTAGGAYAIVLWFFKLLKIRMIPIFTGTIWRKHRPPRSYHQFLLFLQKLYFRWFVDAGVFASEDAANQARLLVGGRNRTPLFTFLPLYKREQFSSVPLPVARTPMRALFAGRIEADKGVFDLIAVARQVEREAPGKVQFDICGDGSQLGELRRCIEVSRLSKIIQCHGFCGREQLAGFLAASSFVIVPTRTELEEGFNMVCAEAILAGRPLITSDVCPALHYVRDAAIEVQPDSPEDYASAVLKFVRDRDLYLAKREACKSLQAQFYEPGNSWGKKVGDAIHAVLASCATKASI